MFLLAGIAQEGRFSIVTTAPNRWVAPVHNRMPLVLGPGESRVWLEGDFGALADRGTVELEAKPSGARVRLCGARAVVRGTRVRLCGLSLFLLSKTLKLPALITCGFTRKPSS